MKTKKIVNSLTPLSTPVTDCVLVLIPPQWREHTHMPLSRCNWPNTHVVVKGALVIDVNSIFTNQQVKVHKWTLFVLCVPGPQWRSG